MISQQPNPTPQFYTVSPQPTPPPARPRDWRKLGYGALAVGVVALLSVAGWNVWQRRPAAVAQRAAEQQVAERTSACADGDTACEEAARRSVAQQAGSVSMCNGLSPDAFAVCVTRIARDQGNPQRCDVLDGGAKDSCRDAAALAYALTLQHVKHCSAAATDAGRVRCEVNVQAAAVRAQACESYGVDPALCAAGAAVAAAVATGDQAQCDVLPGDDRISCLDLLAETDSDSDGLTFGEEQALGTNPRVADSDGDGYNDGAEVASGYNPLGQ